MSKNTLCAVILGAGKGTRMKSPLPKVLHEVGHLSMLGHVIHSCHLANITQIMLVAGHQAETVIEHAQIIDQNIQHCTQDAQLGTAHAVLQAKDFLHEQSGDAVILYADTPFVPADIITNMQALRDKFDMVFLGFHTQNPGGYGRMITAEDGELLQIVEAKDASKEQLDISLCNSGVMLMKASLLAGLLPQIDNKNVKSEYYLTDIVEVGRKAGLKAAVGICPEEDVMGVNSQSNLAHAELIFQTKKRIEMMENGVNMQMPQSVYFSYDTQIGEGCIIEPNVYFGKNVTIGSQCTIKGFSHIEGATLSDNVSVGPFARLRPKTVLQSNVKIGNFVEIKQAVIEDSAKISHLSYIGDAYISKDVNIGAGTITCNYDGVNKHKTFIEAGAFIGSNTSLVAPIHIGKQALIGAGSVITKDVSSNVIALTRSKQKEVPKK